MIGRAVARAVEKTLVGDKDHGREGLKQIVRELRKFAIGLQEHAHVDAIDIFKVCEALDHGIEKGTLP